MEHSAVNTLRPSRDATLMEVAVTFSRRSTCSRLSVGAVFAQEGRVLSTGYNGAPPGMPHCNHDCNCYPYPGSQTSEWLHDKTCPQINPCKTAQHAERNAIAHSARLGVALSNSSLYVTHMPCYDCALMMVSLKVTKVCYLWPYRIRDGITLLRQNGVHVVHFEE